MASSNIVLSCFLIISLTIGARSQRFVEVKCQKSDIVAQYGTDTLLDCNVESEFPDLKIVFVSWKFNEIVLVDFQNEQVKEQKPGYQFASSIKASSRNVSLLITGTSLNHAGEYKCAVVTTRGQGTARVNLVVESNFSKPQIKSDPDKIIPDKSFTLTCEANNGYPEGHLRWVVDETPWKMNPKLEVKRTPDGLYNLTSTLSLLPDSEFRMFVCEVYNAEGVKEDHGEFDVYVSGKRSDPDIDKKANTSVQIVAPLVVIGLLIVGLLGALLLCRRRRQRDVPATADPDESYKMVSVP